MNQHKNAFLIIIAVVLLVYSGFISLFPAILTKKFNIDKFEQKIFEATSLVTTVDNIEYKIKPNFDTIIILRNLSTQYIDEQDCFSARYIELTTTPAAIFTKTFKIKELYLKNVKYSDQTLPDGNNKLAFLPKAFNSEIFGAKHITIVPGPVRVKNFTKLHIAPNVFKENHQREVKYTERDVARFLSSFNFSHIVIK